MQGYFIGFFAALFSLSIYAMDETGAFESEAEFQEYLNDKFEAFVIETGCNAVSAKDEGKALATRGVEVIVIAEAHRNSHTRRHNRVIEHLITEDTIVAVEDDCLKVFDPELELPSQLKYVDKNIAKKATIVGWDHPMIVHAMEGLCDGLLDVIKVATCRERDAYKDVKRVLKEQSEHYKKARQNCVEESRIKLLGDLAIMVINQYMNTAVMLRQLNTCQFDCYLSQIKKFQEQVAFTEEGWILRTATLNHTRDYACSGKFKRAIFVTGRWHADEMAKSPFRKFVTSFYDSFGHQKILLLLTPLELSEEEDPYFEGKEEIDSLFDRLSKNRTKHAKFFEKIKLAISAWEKQAQ
ncbi:MAG TPA: hypothetical protein VEL47_06020 [Myxococcota bacterium]|nr:hypothetical protein [Myxococcota bacterium]